MPFTIRMSMVASAEDGITFDACAPIRELAMPRMFSDDDLDAMQQLRDAFDPNRLCNPGKVLPTPRLCGEVPGPYRQHPVEASGLGERF